jgi:membrane protease YdiL (CAAX protease family)
MTGDLFTLLAFGAVSVAAAILLLPPAAISRGLTGWWIAPAALAVVFGWLAALIDLRGLVVLSACAAACTGAREAARRPVRAACWVAALALIAALLLHVAPGFSNPRVLTDILVSAGGTPYTKYLNFDKGMAGLVLIGLLVPRQAAGSGVRRRSFAFLWRFAIVTTLAMLASLALGFVRWDPKVPEWWPLWSWSMVVLTALPEEALFRGVIQSEISARMRPEREGLAIALSGLLFGIAHLAGGPLYVALASLAGAGYGWIFASTRSLAAAILAHAGVNAVHFFLFTYPALRLR